MLFHALLFECRMGVGTGIIGYYAGVQIGALPELTVHFHTAKLNSFSHRFCKIAKFFLFVLLFYYHFAAVVPIFYLFLFFHPAALMDKRRIKFVIWPFGWIDNDVI